MQAFKLIRDAPFRKMYDNWSEDMRGVIMKKVEKDVVGFAKHSSKYGYSRETKRLVENIYKILHHR